MADPLKRLRYFDGEFLKAADFKAEQDYHVGLLRGKNRSLWVAGIGDGLEVVAASATGVTVKAGSAVDGQGRDVVLTTDTPVDLSGFAVGTAAWITIAYGETDTDPSVPPSAAGNTRVSEQPVIQALTTAPPDPTLQLVVGKATRTSTSLTIDATAPRRVLEPKALGAIRQDISNRLSTSGGTVASLNVTGALSVTGNSSLANVSFSQRLARGTVTPQRDVHIEGTEVHSGGGAGGFSFSNRGSAFVETGGNGDRWVLYASGNQAHLWSGGDKLSVTAGGAMSLVGNLGTHGYSPSPMHGGWGGGIHTWDVEAEGSVWTRNLSVDSGALVTGVVVGRDGNGIDYPWEYETVGVSSTQYNLRLQSPNSVIFHTGGQERMWFDSTGNLVVLGSGGVDRNILTIPSWSGGGLVTWDVFAKGWIYTQTLNASVKKFCIDHPLAPETRDLVHTTLEGPEIGVYYRGEARLENGRAVIELPHYFEALTRENDRSVLITPRLEGDGDAAVVLAASDVVDGSFTVAALGNRDSAQPFYWEVKAVRADVDELEVEPGKPLPRAEEPVPSG